MTRRSGRYGTVLAAAILWTINSLETRAADVLAWPKPTAESRLWTRWWWMGNAVDPENITKQLEQFHKTGLGGVEICPIYGAYGAEKRYVDFLSPAWMNLLAHTYRETKRLDMAVDMTTGTGWPFGGKNVSVEQASSGILMKMYEKYPEPKELAKGKLVCVMRYPKTGTPEEVTGKKIEAVAGDRFLAAVQTGPQQQVKRAAPGGEGNVLDPYSVPSLDQYLGEFDKAMEGFQDDMPRGQFHDSFEYHNATWTMDFLTEFQNRRGYDLRPHLLELSGEGAADTISRIKHDYRETLSDLHLSYMDRWVAWSHSHGSIARNQAHGGPGNLVDVYANADIPECEMFHVYDEAHLPFLKMASSAAHVTGKKLSSAESFTWLGEHFNVPLSEVKPAADFLFLAGVNHTFLHGIPYSPDDAAWPGWQFYASVNFGPSGGLWHDMPAFAGYVARCQSILQANKPSNDVLLYMPFHEFWSDPANNNKLMVQFTTPGEWMKPYAAYGVATKLWQGGYGYDEVSDHLLMEAKVNAKGGIELGGNVYQTLVIPKTPMLPVKTLKQIMELANQGATVAFEGGIPNDVPGFKDAVMRREQLKQLLGSLVFTNLQSDIKSAAVGKGKLVAGSDLPVLFSHAGADPELMVEQGLRFVRRARPDGYDYFVVNRSEKTVDAVRIGRAAKGAVVMDPREENRTGVAKVTNWKTGTYVGLHMAPSESYIIRTYNDQVPVGEAWRDLVPSDDAVALSGSWNVTFMEGGPNLPKSFSTAKLGSWTLQGDEEARRFAGTAKYTLEFDQRPGGGGGGDGAGRRRNDMILDYQLDLGKVGDSARVTLNGKSLGTLWAAPFVVPLNGALRAGKNVLEIEVTNIAVNRIADMDRRGVQWKIFRDINVVNTGYKPLDASKWPVRDAGLMGPVRLVPLRRADEQN